MMRLRQTVPSEAKAIRFDRVKRRQNLRLRAKKIGATGKRVPTEPKRKTRHKKRKPGIGLSPNSTVSSPT